MEAAAPFWTIPLARQVAILQSRAEGLTSEEAAARLAQFGPNIIGQERRFSLTVRMLCRLRNPLVLVLLGAASFAAATGDLASFAIVIAVMLAGLSLDSLQEHRAESAAAALKASVALIETVLRDGHPTKVKADRIV